MCLRNCNFVFVEDLSFWRILDVIKVLEKFGLYGNGLFLLEHLLGWKILILLWLEMFCFINGIRADI